jgi:hypothetical protein
VALGKLEWVEFGQDWTRLLRKIHHVDTLLSMVHYFQSFNHIVIDVAFIGARQVGAVFSKQNEQLSDLPFG